MRWKIWRGLPLRVQGVGGISTARIWLNHTPQTAQYALWLPNHLLLPDSEGPFDYPASVRTVVSAHHCVRWGFHPDQIYQKARLDWSGKGQSHKNSRSVGFGWDFVYSTQQVCGLCQPPESNHPDSGRVRLPKPAILQKGLIGQFKRVSFEPGFECMAHTHTHTRTHTYIYMYTYISKCNYLFVFILCTHFTVICVCTPD